MSKVKICCVFALAVLLSACGGVNTTKPVYQGLLAEAEPRASARQAQELLKAPGLAIVLTESTRDTIAAYKEMPSKTTYRIEYPWERWIGEIAAPIRTLYPNARIRPDLNSRTPGEWVVLVHWTTRHEPFVVGGAVEYHILDDQLARVAAYRAGKSGSCEGYSLSVQRAIELSIECYDRFLSAIIKEASEPFVAAVRN